MEFNFEHELDALLKYFADRGTGTVVMMKEIPTRFHNNQLPKMITILEHRGFIAQFSQRFNAKELPTIFPDLYIVTSAGIYFSYNSSFVEEEKRKTKEKKLFNFQYFTLGWDTLIALAALIISILSFLS